MRDLITSTHEAGHAVLASCFGFDVKRILIRPHPGLRSDEVGRCELHADAVEADGDPFRFAIYLLAGAAAERRMTGSKSARSDHDRVQALTVSRLALPAESSAEAAADWINRAEVTADSLLQRESIWEWIELVAKRLAKRHLLTGRDIQIAGDVVLAQIKQRTT